MAETDNDDVRARSFWSGTITFGLVSIPVELFPANRSQGLSLRMVSEDGTPLARRYFCPREERELDWDEIVRGYEIEKNEFVVVTDDELERLEPDKTRDIDLRRFVNAAEIDPIFFERAYYLTPGGNSTKAYRLLAATMEQMDRAGIATFVMRGKEYLVAILAENGILRAETLRFADEVRSPADIGLPEPVRPQAAAVKSIEKAIASLVEDELDEAELTDGATRQLLELVARKQRSGTGVVAAPEGAAGPAAGVIDLMEVLMRSLEGNADAQSDERTAKPAAKKESKPATRKTPKPGERKAAKSTGKKTAKSGARKTAKSAARKTAKSAAKKTAKSASRKMSKPAPGKKSQPTAKTVGKAAKRVVKKATAKRQSA